MCCGGLISVQYFLVVFLNDSFHIVHAWIANFNGVLVEDFVVLVTGGEMSGDKPEECFTDVGLYVSAVRRVEPDYLSLPILAVVWRSTLLGCKGAVGHVREICCVSASFQGVLVVLLGFVE